MRPRISWPSQEEEPWSVFHTLTLIDSVGIVVHHLREQLPLCLGVEKGKQRHFTLPNFGGRIGVTTQSARASPAKRISLCGGHAIAGGEADIACNEQRGRFEA